MVPYFSLLIDRDILRNLTTSVDDFLDSGVLRLECLSAHIICHLIELTRDIAKSYRPLQMPFELPRFLKCTVNRVLRRLPEYPCGGANYWLAISKDPYRVMEAGVFER